MKYNPLGNSELTISSIGFGAMSLDLNKPQEATDLVNYAFHQGINYFDTADLYDKGENEKLLGKAIKPFRKDIVLATKVGNKWRHDGNGWDWDVSPAYIAQAVEDSLIRLQTDYIDLYQIHGGTNEDDYDAVVATMESLVQHGKIRCYGISSIRPNVFTHYCTNSNIVSNMMQYSILDSRPEPYIDLFEESSVNIIARGVLAQGLLMDKQVKPYLDYAEKELQVIQHQLKEYCKTHQLASAVLPLAYVLQQKVVSSALVGTRSKEQLNDILQAYNTLQPVNFDRFDFRKIKYIDHLI